MSSLDDRVGVLYALTQMRHYGAQAHDAAGEDSGRTGPIRDLIFGLNTAIDALMLIVEEQR